MLRSISRHLQRGCRSLSTDTFYPYSQAAIIPPPSPSPQSTNDVARLRLGKGLMEYLQKTLPTTEKQTMLATLFSRTHPDRIRPGAVVTVNLAHAPTIFSGVVISLRRRGPDSSFVLRNVVQRTGVEMQFFPNSPHVKTIKVLAVNDKKTRADGQKKVKGPRLNKLFYLRDYPEKMTALAAGIKAI